MTFTLEGHPLVQLAVAGCAFVFVVSFAAGFYLMLQVIGKIQADRKLGWGERAARGSNAMNRLLIADEFRLLRRRMFAACAGMSGSFVLLLLLTAGFGKRVG